MSETSSGRHDVDQDAVLAASAFKVGDLVDVTHPIYSGRGQIVQKLWLENIKSSVGDPSHFLTWMIHPLTDGAYPGMFDIIDPQYGLEERGRTIRAALVSQ